MILSLLAYKYLGLFFSIKFDVFFFAFWLWVDPRRMHRLFQRPQLTSATPLDCSYFGYSIITVCHFFFILLDNNLVNSSTFTLRNP
eukprot:UN06790